MPRRARGTLVFLHGRFGLNRLWEPLVGDLSSQFRCLSIELPGFGGSFCVDEDRSLGLDDLAERVMQAADRLEVSEPSVWIGHDLGGAIAQVVAARRGGAGLVLLNSASLFESMTGGEEVLPRIFGAWALRMRLVRLLRASTNLTREQRFLVRAPPLRSVSDLSRSWPATELEHARWRQRLGSFSPPVLLLWGMKDSLNRPEIASELMRVFRSAELYEHETCGHWSGLEEPAWVLSKLRAFLFRAFEPVRTVRKSL